MIKVVNIMIIRIKLIEKICILFDMLFVVAMTSIYDQGNHLNSQICINH